ncbi:MAG: tRNA(Ile)-lysidine synthetase, partial [Lachnospiraceae bacterium]|nr:tRNA(Ile)-lysidine synthetase [Lachnospiraceae bacterium]
MNNNIYFRIKRYIEENKLVQNGDKIVVGLSGGADSVFLFVMLCELSKEYDIEVTAVHINHGIRGKEALRDEEYAVELAGSYGRECRVFRADIPELARKEKLTEEEAGRRYRYDSFERVRN